jgi:hypothetical protein
MSTSEIVNGVHAATNWVESTNRCHSPRRARRHSHKQAQRGALEISRSTRKADDCSEVVNLRFAHWSNWLPG